MTRTTLLETVEPLTHFGQAVNAGGAFSQQWRGRATNEMVVVERITRVLTLMSQRRLSDAALASRQVVDATTAVVSDVELLAYIESTSTLIADREPAARAALTKARHYAQALGDRTDLPGLPALAEIGSLSDDQIVAMVRAMAQLGSGDPAAVARSLRVQAQARIRAHHAHIVLGASRRRGSTFPSSTTTEVAIRQRASALRDAVHIAAAAAADADADWFVALAGAVAHFERDWAVEVGDACIALLVAASGPSASLATRRTAALAYDAVRLGLTWLAGTYELMLAWATNDSRTLREWSTRAALPLDSGVLDLPRTDAADIADGTVPTGSLVEVAGLVTFAQSELQAGRVRTVVRLDDLVTVYFPFSAVDGFGILPGVWCQARGTVLDESKGGFPAPAVAVRRRKLGDAARAGFNEYLEYQGRGMFDRMRAGNDATAGRLAHDPRTANEASDWN